MSATISIRDEVTPLLRKIERAGPGALRAAAQSAANVVRSHFTRLAGQRHRPAAPFNFYANAGSSTSIRVAENEAAIVINQAGIAQRYFGGTIRARRSKYLAIPDSSNNAAIGRRPREIEGLHFRPTRRGGGLFDKAGTPFFWLVKSVSQKADPSVLPTDAELVRAMTQTINDRLERLHV